MSKKWFQNWFSSPYYHILYHQRNDAEAEFFIDNLCTFLKPDSEAKLLDIACGRGRHSVYLHKKGYDVTGIDLSNSNIKFAQQFEKDRLQFFVHDMRNTLYVNYFDIAFNIFTSFGYFDSDKDHLKALKVFNKSLKKSGLLVFDYFNSEKIMRNLSPEEIKCIEGIEFHIRKKIEDKKIIKNISFEHENQNFSFNEEVKAFSKSDFEEMFNKSGFKILNTFGDYSLNSFDEIKSDRLIFICQKNND